MKSKPQARKIAANCLLLLLLLGLAWCALSWISKSVMEDKQAALWNYDCASLSNLGRLWNEKGRPSGPDLSSFVADYKENYAIEERMLQVATNNFYVVFSLHRPRTQGISKMYLCTNDMIIAESPNGIRTIVTRSESGTGWEPKPSETRR